MLSCESNSRGIICTHNPDPTKDPSLGIGIWKLALPLLATDPNSKSGAAIKTHPDTPCEICLAWIYKRLIVALRVEGWSGRMADQRVDERVRYQNEPDDRVFGATSAGDAVNCLVDHMRHYSGQPGAIRQRSPG